MSDVSYSWSRRRAAVAAEAVAQEHAEEDAALMEQHAAYAGKSDADILEDLGLPDPDTLVRGDDFKAFLAKAVPDHLRKRALRTLWRSDPVLACMDGLNDYDDDYLTGSFGQGPISTTYKVGKGMLSHLLEMERQNDLSLSPPEDRDAPDTQERADDADGGVTDPDITGAADPAVYIQEQPDMPMARRMSFHFGDDDI